MAAMTNPACLVIGVDNHVGAYLARLLDARGVALAGFGDAALLGRLGVADAVVPVSAGDLAAAVGDARLVFAVSDGNAERADLFAGAIEAAAGAARLVHVADVADLDHIPVQRTVARVAAARAAGAEAATILLEAHDSRFGRHDTLTARIIGIAQAASRGDAAGAQTIIEPGGRDWGWTPEYVDAVQRLASRERLVDMVVASGHTLTAADIAAAAFGYFGADAASHVRIEGTGTTAPPIDTSALKSLTGWSASTWGSDLVKALCEGAGDRTTAERRG